MRISIPVLIRSVYSIGSIKTKYDLGYATTFTNSSLLSTDSVETILSSPKSRCQDLKKKPFKGPSTVRWVHHSENISIAGYFGFVFEENSVREIT